ncbi:MAG TPA: Gp37 family protein [Candidatus Binataceae bacterium]|nr:Gp37 family protein [Candidatus Binataceae bacterium]
MTLDTAWAGSEFSPPTPIDIATIENALLTRLRSQITTVEIIHYPDQPESWRMTHRIGAILVRYAGAKYGTQLDTAAVIQERELRFELFVMMRDLGWGVGGDPGGTSPGAYAMIEAVRAALTGFIVPGCRKLYPLSEEFSERDKQGGVWTYRIFFALSTVAVEPSTIDEFPLFVRGVVMDEAGQTAITVGPSSYTFDTSGNIQLPHGNVFALAVTGPGNVTLIQSRDYSVDRADGIISIVSGGSASAGETVQVTYSYADEAIASAGETAPLA